MDRFFFFSIHVERGRPWIELHVAAPKKLTRYYFYELKSILFNARWSKYKESCTTLAVNKSLPTGLNVRIGTCNGRLCKYGEMWSIWEVLSDYIVYVSKFKILSHDIHKILWCSWRRFDPPQNFSFFCMWKWHILIPHLSGTLCEKRQNGDALKTASRNWYHWHCRKETVQLLRGSVLTGRGYSAPSLIALSEVVGIQSCRIWWNNAK